ncbi:serine hydrolase domain-containing protein [Evansella cellulosilytica]|uniref:Beta-lactamase n=1 Tax=Evansella cellulosilytica (strain ATCC 21833 / DSM 2522 / FERM P-1141 / JCM 9156 / N-4) TaxID=649639 RepID=E6TZ62_EVAC2|nr:serine hydrolase [Evansella cellulosilytica]ADU28924.1 beta-lactamase [Evansella cellulosilytica DSM 2522]
MDKINKSALEGVINKINFSGVILAKNEQETLIEAAYGYANRSDEIENKQDTRFGIASGCKLFTAIAICQLVESGKLTMNTKLKDCLPIEFPHFDDSITIHHLLTHSSGVPDYFDESVMEDFEDLWKDIPMYQIKQLKDFLPLFQNNKMMFKPGEKFHYNNSGYILLGLIIEQATGKSFQDYIIENIFLQSSMEKSGYFTFDNLPKNTAQGYIDEENGTWRSNIYSLPVRGGSDGGAFVTAQDMINLWDSLLNYHLLSEQMTDMLLTPHIHIENEEYYGYGVWITKKHQNIYKYHVMGYDPGVSFASAYYPGKKLIVAIPSNQSYGPHDITEVLETNI